MQVNRNEKILVVGPSWVGDMVLAQSLFKTLAVQHVGAAITVLAPEWTRPVTARMPELANTVGSELEHGRLDLKQRLRLAARFRQREFSRAIVLPNSLKAALIPYWARIPERVGYRGEMRWGLLNDVRRLDRAAMPMAVQRFVALGLPADATLPAELPAPRLTATELDRQRTLGRLGLERPSEPLLVMCPGAEYGPAKRWPPEHFAAVARIMRDRGWSVWLVGSENDATAAAAIRRGADGACTDLVGRTRLAEAIDVLSAADAVVTNDSGLMHVAAALERNVIALFGSSSAAFTPPLGRRSMVLSLELDCSPCFARECPLHHFNCLRQLKPARVIEILDSLRV